MNPKLLKWWEKEFDTAVAYACVYGVLLSVDQFAASRHMEAQERDELLAHLIKVKSISPY